jgi:hypothetical protein
METTLKTQKAYDLHQDHTEWINSLDFYKEEIIIFQRRIEEIASKNNSSKILKMIDSFQNRLIIQRNEIDILKHNISDHEVYIKNKVAHNPAADHIHLLDHNNEKDSFLFFEKLFAELRKDLYIFLSKHM